MRSNDDFAAEIESCVGSESSPGVEPSGASLLALARHGEICFRVVEAKIGLPRECLVHSGAGLVNATLSDDMVQCCGWIECVRVNAGSRRLFDSSDP